MIPPLAALIVPVVEVIVIVPPNVKVFKVILSSIVGVPHVPPSSPPGEAPPSKSMSSSVMVKASPAVKLVSAEMSIPEIDVLVWSCRSFTTVIVPPLVIVASPFKAA